MIRALPILLLALSAAAQIDWGAVASVTLPTGEVASIAIDGETAWTRPNPLPYDSEVEYLESTGTQWINTGVTINTATDEVHVSFRLMATTSYKWCFGEYESGKYFAVGHASGSNGYLAYANANSTTYADSQITNTRHEFVANSNGALFDGVKKANFASFASTVNIYLFAMKRPSYNDNYYCSKTRIYAYKHWRNGILIRDYTPVRVGTVGTFFDRVSGTLCTVSGTGALILGPDKP